MNGKVASVRSKRVRAPNPASTELADIAARQAALIQALGEVVYEWQPPVDVLVWDGDYTRILGYTPEEMGSGTESWTSRVHPDDLESVLGEVEAARTERRPYNFEYRFRHRDGHYVWVQDRGVLFVDTNGELERMIGVILDITPRKRAEEELKTSERLRRLIIETDPECVALVGRDGRLIEMNRAGLKMLEVESVDEIARNAIVDFVAPTYQPAFRDVHRRVMRGETGTLEFEIVGRRGTRRWMETYAVPLRDDAGAVTALLGVTRDVTEKRVQQERILRLSRMRRVMSSINALIVRTRSRTELFQEACRIAVEEGGFILAWVAAREDSGDSAPAAMYGRDGGHLSNMEFRREPGASEQVQRGLREVLAGRPWVRNNLLTEPMPERWRAAVRELGYGSSVSYPLVVGGQLQGCFNLYAAEIGFFDDEEMALLSELAGDLSYALEFIIKDERLDFLSIYDPLTRLPNRSLFMRRLQGFTETAKASGRRLALVMLDIERFKAINDAVGQDGGDQLLKVVGERLKFHAGGPGYMARIAGDRFAAVIPDIEHGTDVEALVYAGGWDRLDPPFQHGDQEFSVTFKIGIAVFPQDGNEAEALLRNAELALKHGKVAGRRYTRYVAEMGDLAMRKLQLQRQLRRALERDEFVLHYQPKVDLRTGFICGAEALLRWQSPEQGLVMPSAIVPLMEETGLILDVGHWVLERAMREREQWLRDGLRAPRVGVNVSAVQLRERDFVASVRHVLAEAPGAAAGLELEVTESMMMSDPDDNVATLRTLRELGVTVAMDDFGTGYSSLGYLARLPLNSVKIDRSFIDTMVQSSDTMSIVSSIIALAHSMNLRVVAEGVETDEQCRYLRLLRCDELQGFLFSKPVPAAEFAALLRSGPRLP